jgi:hypothetical protein
MTSSHLPRINQAVEQLQQELDRLHAEQHAQEARDAEARQRRRDDDAVIAAEARRARHRLELGAQFISVDRYFFQLLLHMAMRPMCEELSAAMAAGQQLTERGIRARIEMFERNAGAAIRGRL